MIEPSLKASPSISVREALKRLDSSGLRMLIILDDQDHLLGVLTDGDVRRAILADASLERSIEGIFNSKPRVLVKGTYDLEKVKKEFLEQKYEAMPIVTSDGRIEDLLFWNDLITDSVRVKYGGEAVPMPVVIMAGGKGTRMAPFTTVLPKPLIPIGEKTILELIIDDFRVYGMDEYYFTLNYRGEIIKAYFDGLQRDYSLEYVWEKDFYGTAGCLNLLKGHIQKTFLVSNCDILVKANMAEVYAFHREQGAMLTIISSIQHHVIPYGVVEFGNGGIVSAIREKPEFSFTINTGVYILEPECLEFIPGDRVFHMTHLIDRLMAEGKKVCTYPINEGEYIDIGQWEEYRSAIAALGGS